MEQKVTVAILTGGRRHCLEQCLSCIYETSEDSEREIIIWDNASEDDTQDFLGSLMGYPGIRAIRSEQNIPAMPIVYMLKLVKTRYTLILDDDSWIVTKGWAKAIMEKMEENPELCAVRFSLTSDERQRSEKPSRPRFRRETLVGRFKPQEGPDFILNEGGLSQNGTVWRTEYIRGERQTQQEGIIEDWGNVWHPRLANKSWGAVTKYLMIHANQPWWYLGEGERYWNKKANWGDDPKHKEFHLNWLKETKEWWGWGRPIEKFTTVEELK